ncbi:unnamed protein product [Brassica oleracea var. botrytis]
MLLIHRKERSASALQAYLSAWELEAASNEVEGQGDDPNPSGVKGKEGSRKNPRE